MSLIYPNKYVKDNDLLVSQNKPSLIEIAQLNNVKLSTLKKSYDQGLKILTATVEAFALFDKYQNSISLCPTCGAIVSGGKQCNHEVDYYDLFDQELDYYDYLNYMSFERFMILTFYGQNLLKVLRAKR